MVIIKATGKIMGDYYMTSLNGLDASRDKAARLTEDDAEQVATKLANIFAAFTISVEEE